MFKFFFLLVILIIGTKVGSSFRTRCNLLFTTPGKGCVIIPNYYRVKLCTGQKFVTRKIYGRAYHSDISPQQEVTIKRHFLSGTQRVKYKV